MTTESNPEPKPSILDSVRVTTPRAPCLTIYGKAGVGKSTLAASFPDPLFLLTEESAVLGINAFPVFESFTSLWATIKQLLALETIPYQTIVIDSLSQLDALVVNYILDKDAKEKKGGKRPTSLANAAGGYGKGYDTAQQVHRGFRHLLNGFLDRGIAVVFLGHLAITKYKAPDQDDYDVYNIVMNHDKSREVYLNDVDAVLFGHLKSFVEELDSGRNVVRSTDKRVLHTGLHEGKMTKNRFNMPSEIEMSFDAIAKYVPFYKGGNDE